MMVANRTRELDARDAAAAFGRGELVVVDVRESTERAEGHISGSHHIPVGEVPRRLSELPADKPVAFICRSGGRSAVATAQAAEQRKDVADVRGGMNAWTEAGLPVTTYSSPSTPNSGATR